MAVATIDRAAVRTADLNTPGPTVRVVSRYAGNRVILENGVDDYHVNGGVKGRMGGRYLKFTNGACNMPDTPDWHDALRAHPEYGVTFFLADDLQAAARDGIPVHTGPVVVDGMRTAGTQPTAPPVVGWNEMGARELRPLIQGGQVGDPKAAMLYEMGHRQRSQVMTALSQVIARDSGVDPEPEPEAAEHSVALPKEGVA